MSAIAGGCIVGMPLLYTMEMWFHGMVLSPLHQLAVLAVALVANLAFCIVSGFRENRGFWDAVNQTITSVAIGILFSFAVLWLIGNIRVGMPIDLWLGKVLLEALAVSLGVSYANAHFRGQSRTGEGDGEDPVEAAKRKGQDLEHLQFREDLTDAGATLAGSLIFALNIAPTEEVLLISMRIEPWRMLLLLAGTLLLCYIILYASGFENQPVYLKTIFQSPWAETVLTVALSLAVSLLLLWMLGERQVFANFGSTLHGVVVLGVPATVGGAAGRLVL